MVPGIHRTSELVREIAAASGEQNQGVGQITSTMNHLSSTTQQTASASEQLSATAEELSAQAQQLLELVSFFKLADDAPRRSPATSRVAAGAPELPAPSATARRTQSAACFRPTPQRAKTRPQHDRVGEPAFAQS
jgi:ABC-type transporter Mla subunit MlaD